MRRRPTSTIGTTADDKRGTPRSAGLRPPLTWRGQLGDPGDDEHRAEQHAGDDDHRATLGELDSEPFRCRDDLDTAAGTGLDSTRQQSSRSSSRRDGS